MAFDQHHMPDGSVVRIPYIERLVVEPLRIEPTGIKPQRGIFDLANVIGQSHEPTPIATIENTPEPHFRVTTRDLEQILTPHPFTFPKALHPYIYGGITGSGSLGGAALVQVAWQGRHHSYYYNLGRPEVVYYLPDAFKVARVPEAPHTPMLSVGFTSSDGTVASASATVVFAATPVVTAQRLRSAIETIAQRSGVDGGSIVLEPLMADPSRLRLCLALPGAAGATTEILDARIDLRTGLSGGFVLGLDRFRALFDRMHAPNPTLFTGEVEVRLDVADRPAEQIPVLANLADLPGPLLGVEFDLDAASATARITNIIESPVRIRELKVRWGDAPCALEGLSSGTVLAAGSSLVASLTPGSAPDGSDAKPVVTLLDAVVEPDPAAIWAAICEDQSTQVRRSISVNTPVELFSPSGGDTAILEIVVELQAEHGGPVTAASVNAASPRVESFVDFPIADLIVRSLETGAYRYRVTTVRLDRVTVGEWKIATSPILWIVTQDLV